MSAQVPPDAGPGQIAHGHGVDLRARDAVHRAESERLLLLLAEALDSLDRLLAEPRRDHESVLSGVRLVARQLESSLRAAGMEPVGTPGERADPSTHEVAETRVVPGAGPDEVVEVRRRGYRFGGRLLRAAHVVIATPEGATEQPELPRRQPTGERKQP